MKKKILFIIWSYTLGGGAEALLTSIVNHLNPEKYDISIIEFYNADVKEEPVNSNIHVLPPIRSGGGCRKCFQTLLLYLCPQLLVERHIKGDYDLYVAFNYLVPTFLLPKNTKNIQWIHGNVYDLLGKKEVWKRKKQDRALDKANKLVVISDYTEQSVKKLFPRHENKIVKLYNGIDIENIKNKALEETNIRLENPSVVFIGRLEDGKNPLRCIDVLKLVHSKYGEEIHLYLMGEGELRNAILEKANKYKLLDFVHLLGYQQNPFPIIQQCNVVCVLSRSEGFGLCWLEGLALGKPFVGTITGAAEQLSNKGRCGYAVRTDEEAAEAIMMLISMDKEKIAIECEKSVSRFEFNSYIQSIECLMDSVIIGKQ